jgi:radical SAM superfamily enzyme YgiQ (UPF0313 family)
VKELRVLFTAAPGVALPVDGTVQAEENLPPSAIYALAAVVEAAGFACTILDPVRYWRDVRTEDALATLVDGHDVVCVSANVATWPLARPLIAAFARCRPRPFIVVGGIHPTTCAEHVITTTQADCVVRGEGERTLPSLLRAIVSGEELEDIPGLTVRGPHGATATSDAPQLSEAELAASPHPLWQRLPPGVYSFIPVEASRGCRFACTFCSIQHKRHWRPLAVEHVAERIRQGVRALPLVRLRALMFSDDCFTTDPERVRRIAEILASEAPGVGVGMEGRATDVLRPQVLESLARMPVEFLQVGVECGYDEGLRRIGKGVTVDQVIASAHALHKVGFETVVKYSFIVGFPWESWTEMGRTVAFALSLASCYGNRCQIAWLMVAPGSAIYDTMRAAGLVAPVDFDGPNVERWELFQRVHPQLDRPRAEALREYAQVVRQTVPWVAALGGVFDPLDRTFRLPDGDRGYPAGGRCGRDAQVSGWSGYSFWEQLPPVLQKHGEGG